MSNETRSKIMKRIAGIRPFLVAGGLVGLLAATLLGNSSAAEPPRLVPPAIRDAANAAGPQTAVFAGGCFWGVQGVFQHVEGVINATSGYAGGSAETATYELTETGSTGHAEAVQISFDPQKVSYGRLLQIYFSAAHDPTQINRQGPDIGSQYRSVVFPANEEQAQVASDYIAQLEKAGVFDAKIATTIEPGKPFYKAEAYHQDFMVNNPTHPYIVFNEQEKIENLKAFFPQFYRQRPVLFADNQG
ncbi:peptide-methionine (S)-S-oxide reductase MsrA [Pararhizobium sp. BT-229]|uniref:peptide-methionine (S)-S-oxide reductase MsrA n=1 Tax=Pararhizobium sp. BT-229 TaxID=2986923 RepID=UPI0021F7EBAE|nr:peptide-methionine (S)-S-oxide reductase MsrA [Pararhizobium sp. BT-229]MCV9962694.1 peptide-methionine (S)-S-oxide reductase MsrA [Pararhizobium sp. BT-229]